ncbi:peptide ABC transporter permease [Shouchella clausii]|jgi:peptide/nickel transport system permease protein|uniref:Peptide ABC transporter permease n=1 Tax=Shouchella clausii TaxID=79880 RepID=A0A268S2Q5_SHOCL|nr:ABC transporter permease [Shouchella clausii]PAD43315.1 peptide ABC transporter permease [Bacillus sp. 7520-S]MBU8598522.1 ABC transporter permease [Shouchella clausii]MCM3551114.1 ABC transporter permease [Shouchella clausii]MCY1104112.1 ABC transporter permease [Shouchella clausii]PAD08004.1 peptide ABC transporter permease [Shouchella clausii]
MALQLERLPRIEKRRPHRAIKRWARLLLRSKTGTVGLAIVVAIIVMAVFASLLAPYDPNEMNPANMLQPPVWVDGGTAAHILGTDNLGRDILSRVIYGSQISLLVGIAAVAVAGFIGVTIGIVSGYYGGWVDSFFMRLVDSFLSIPNILFALVILSVFGPSVWTLIIVLGVTNWVNYARLVRGEVLSLKEREFVKAARSIGVKNGMLMFRHLLPNVLPAFIVISTLSVATTIILEASLSFLGLGIQPPDVSWGGILSDGRDYLATSWWLATFPGLAITITVLGIIFLGDWLRDVLDPRSQSRR